jgi:hypothetical protein
VTYSRWERLHFKIFGRWPQAVVDRRLDELDLKEGLMKERGLQMLAEARRVNGE